MSIATSGCFCFDHIKHCPSASFVTGVCVQTSKQQYRTSTSKYTHTMSPHSETPVTATMSGAKFSRRYEESSSIPGREENYNLVSKILSLSEFLLMLWRL